MSVQERSKEHPAIRARMAEYRATHRPTLDVSTLERARWAAQTLARDNAILARALEDERTLRQAAEREARRGDERAAELATTLAAERAKVTRAERALLALQESPQRLVRALLAELRRQAEQTRWRFPATWRSGG